jgi:hypothetical protein
MPLESLTNLFYCPTVKEAMFSIAQKSAFWHGTLKAMIGIHILFVIGMVLVAPLADKKASTFRLRSLWLRLSD